MAPPRSVVDDVHAKEQLNALIETTLVDIDDLQRRVHGSGVGPEVQAALTDHRDRLDEMRESEP